MDKTPQTVALSLIAFLLIAILATLITIAWRGVRVEHTGVVSLGGMLDAIPLQMSEPITIQMPEPARMIATGAEGDTIPVDLSLPVCPECGGAMVPVRWNPWTGAIDWSCPICGDLSAEEP